MHPITQAHIHALAFSCFIHVDDIIMFPLLLLIYIISAELDSVHFHLLSDDALISLLLKMDPLAYRVPRPRLIVNNVNFNDPNHEREPNRARCLG